MGTIELKNLPSNVFPKTQEMSDLVWLSFKFTDFNYVFILVFGITPQKWMIIFENYQRIYFTQGFANMLENYFSVKDIVQHNSKNEKSGLNMCYKICWIWPITLCFLSSLQGHATFSNWFNFLGWNHIETGNKRIIKNYNRRRRNLFDRN